MKNIKNKIIAVFLLVAFTLSFTGCRIGNTEFIFKEEEYKPDVLFVFNDEECKLPEAMIYLCNYKNLYGNVFDLNLWDGSFDEASLEAYVKDVTVEEIEMVYCIYGLAIMQGYDLTDSERQTVANMAQAYFDSLSSEEIEFMNVTEDDVQQAYERYAVAQKLYISMTEEYTEEVSDDEARVIWIQQIYVTKSENATAVANKLEAGEDFSTVAATYNEASSIECYIARGELPEEVEEVAFNLNDGEVSGCIETADGYYFINCISKFVEELTEANKEVIRVRKQKAEFNELFNEYAADATFHFNTDVWDAITLTDTDFLTTDSFFELYETYMGE